MSRYMPTVCVHGVTVDWGDFGPCQNCDNHADWECPNLANCPKCNTEAAHKRPGPWTITKTSHSRNPWRIIDANGTEITFETQDINIHESTQTLPVYGSPTKADAIAALGRLAAVLYSRLTV
jgi:hypothetical protein